MAMSWSWPSGLLSLSEGRISLRKSNDDEVTTVHHHNDEVTTVHQRREKEIIEIKKDKQIQENEMVKQARYKRRKLTSKVWDEFTKYEGEDGKQWATCKHCGKEFDGSSKKGTTHLKNHLERCQQKRNGGGDADKSLKTGDLTPPVVLKEISMIDLIKHAENWDPAVINSRKVDILEVYEEEKEKLSVFLNTLSCRFSLTMEKFGDLHLLTVHYIDDCWDLKRKVISLQVGRSDSEIFLATQRELCLYWKIHRNICSIVSKHNYEVIGEISSWVSEQGSLPFGGQLFAIEEFLDTLEMFYLTSEDRAFELCKAVNKLRECLNYVHETPLKEHNFRTAVDKVKSMGKKVPSESVPFWIYSFKDIEIAVGYKEAFYELEQVDPDFKSRNLTEEKWDEATATYKHLKALDNIFGNFLSSSKYTTPNVYFPKICDIYWKSTTLCKRNENCHVCKETSLEIKNFDDKYWRKYSLVLVIAVILDPRFKMDIVQLWYKEIFGSDAGTNFAKITDDFVHVYKEYEKEFSNSMPGGATSSTSYKMLDTMGRPCTSTLDVNDEDIASPKSELDRYLNEPKVPPIEDFDLLAWWLANTPFFPTLARMARDFLAIPLSFCTSTSDSSLYKEFKNIINCKVLNDDIKPACVCLKEWL